jgi:hypothetical protein
VAHESEAHLSTYSYEIDNLDDYFSEHWCTIKKTVIKALPRQLRSPEMIDDAVQYVCETICVAKKAACWFTLTKRFLRNEGFYKSSRGKNVFNNSWKHTFNWVDADDAQNEMGYESEIEQSIWAQQIVSTLNEKQQEIVSNLLLGRTCREIKMLTGITTVQYQLKSIQVTLSDLAQKAIDEKEELPEFIENLDLTDQQRRLILYSLKNLGRTEIATKIGCSPNAISSVKYVIKSRTGMTVEQIIEAAGATT